jgi:hypothetical protein
MFGHNTGARKNNYAISAILSQSAFLQSAQAQTSARRQKNFIRISGV